MHDESNLFWISKTIRTKNHKVPIRIIIDTRSNTVKNIVMNNKYVIILLASLISYLKKSYR